MNRGERKREGHLGKREDEKPKSGERRKEPLKQTPSTIIKSEMGD